MRKSDRRSSSSSTIRILRRDDMIDSSTSCFDPNLSYGVLKRRMQDAECGMRGAQIAGRDARGAGRGARCAVRCAKRVVRSAAHSARRSRISDKGSGIRDSIRDKGLGILCAGVAELADARDLKSRDRKVVWVRSPPPALSRIDQAHHLRGGGFVHARVQIPADRHCRR